MAKIDKFQKCVHTQLSDAMYPLCLASFRMAKLEYDVEAPQKHH